MSKHCSKCGTENPDEAFWCINCNARFVDNVFTVQEELKPKENIQTRDEPEEIHWDKYFSSLQNQKQRTRNGLSILKISVIIIFVVIVCASLFFFLNANLGGENLNWDKYGFPWEGNDYPGTDDFPWETDTNYGGSQDFSNVGQFGEDYWFSGNTLFTSDGWSFEITNVKDYTLDGIILGLKVYDKKDILDDPSTTFSPIDLLIGVEDVKDNIGEYTFSITAYSNRVAYYQFEGSSENFVYFNKHVGNNHIIPHNKEVFDALENIDAMDKVILQGSLVNLQGIKDSRTYSWSTDTKIGNFACEIILVDSITTDG